MRDHIPYKRGLNRTACLAVVVIVALTCSLGLGSVNLAQAPSGAKVPTAFEVASIKLIGPEGPPQRPGMFMNFGAPCGFTGLVLDAKKIQITLWTYTLIQLAYGPKGSNCRQQDLLTGGPEWVRTERYDIEAVIPAGTPTYMPGQLAQRDAPALQMMFQTLLTDRFKLKISKVKKEVPGVELTVAKGTPKLVASSESDPPQRGIRQMQENGQTFGRLVANKITMADFANMLVQVVGAATVIDKTGLAGQFNITLEFDANGVTRPTVATALQELGLKIENIKVPAEGLIIESIEKPSAN